MAAQAPTTSELTAKRFFYERYKSLVTSVTGPLTKSAFQKEGKLTPQEFLEAGDNLTLKSPAWEWQSGPASYNPALPLDKKYLVMKSVPCRCRANEVTQDGVPAGPADQQDDGWTVTAAPIASSSGAAAGATHVVADTARNTDAVVHASSSDDDSSDDDTAPSTAASMDPALKLLRRYDVFVLYDAYYASPRFYLLGYSVADGNRPLTKDEMMEDVAGSNHKEQTVTVDLHPVTNVPCISIHPCKHAEAMKHRLAGLEQRFLDAQEAAMEGMPAGTPQMPFVFPTFLALFVFLSFISGVVPNIDYDVGIQVEN